MADKKKSSDETEKKADEVKNANDEAPEVEVEVVEDDSEPVETIEAATNDKHEEEISDDFEPVEEAALSAEANSGRSPGLILFGFFALAALAIFALFRLNGGGDKPDAEAPTEIAAAEAIAGLEEKTALATNGIKPEAISDIGSDGGTQASNASENGAVGGIESPDASENTPDTEEVAASETSTTNTSQQTETAAEGAADLFAADPEGDSEPIDPRAAIEALQREAAERTAAEEGVDAIETAAETVLSPEEATAIASEAASTKATEVAETVAAEAVTDSEATESEVTSALMDSADTTVASAEETTTVDTAAAAELTEEVAAIDNAEEETATLDTEQLATKDFSKFANEVSPNTGKIANELETLKEALRQETDALSAAVSEGRELTEQQSTRITELRQSLEQALAERDERANTEIAELRSRLDKIQSGSAEIPAGRQAAASLALLSLQRAVDDGAPYTDELEVLSRLAPNAGSLKGLRRSAATGAPTLASLKTQFKPAVRTALAASDDGNASGLMGRIQKLISVRPATPQPGDRPAAVISRAEANLEKDDLANTVRELNALQGGSAEAFSDWLVAAQQRLDATNAIEELNTALLNNYNN